jgi:hypothetical protein
MAKRRKLVRVVFAGPILEEIMDLAGCAGITMPWRTVYLSGNADWRVLRHELVHLAQIRRDGDIRFWWRYFLASWQHGYAGNPYEIEADRIAGTAGYRV